MNSKEWLLNPHAIAVARKCIIAVELELGIRLKLSHPNFLEMLQEYGALTDSDKINTPLLELYSLAVGKTASTSNKVHVLKGVSLDDDTFTLDGEPTQEMVTFRGKEYPKFNDAGDEFQGLYRGQARYA